MDADTFDDLVKRLTGTQGDRLATPLTAPGSRRALLRLVTALPLTGFLASLLTEAGEAGGRQQAAQEAPQAPLGGREAEPEGEAHRAGEGQGQGQAGPAHARAALPATTRLYPDHLCRPGHELRHHPGWLWHPAALWTGRLW